MLNMKAMPAARGAGLAAYLWKEAVGQEPWVAKTDLDYLASQVAQGWVDFEDVVDLEYAKRLERVRAAGVEDIDHGLLRDKASDDVVAAIQRYEAAQAITGVEYRRDTAPELAALIGIDPAAAPRLEDLKNLLSAKAAGGGEIDGKKRSATLGSLELIFSADKSVSIVYGLASPDERTAIAAAQRAAVDRAMHQIADKIGFIRNRRDGLDKRDPADVTWVQWQHHVSRRGDPQLHTHVSLLNVVRSQVDGKVGTLDTFLLHGFYHKPRETYHRTLASGLGNLGFQVELDAKATTAVITNVPEQILRHFSGRTAEAERWLQEKLGPSFASLTPHQRSTWLGHAAAKTRPPKAMHYVAGNGYNVWHARAAGQGYVPPPRFIDPRLLHMFNVVHTTVNEAERHLAGIVPPQQQPHAPKRQNDRRQSAGHEAPDEHKQRGWWKYDELQKGHGLYHGHKL